MKAKQAAKKLQSMGQGGDTILAHINPEEAAVLKAGGGSGNRNPRTGLLSFGGYEGGGTGMGDAQGEGGFGRMGGDWGDAGMQAGALAADIQAQQNDLAFDSAMLGNLGYAAPPTHAQDDSNLLAFDRSQPNPMSPWLSNGLVGLLGPVGLAARAGYSALDAARVNRNSGAGYGSGWGYGNETGNMDRESGMGGDMTGNTAAQLAASGLLGQPSPALEPWKPRPFIPKFGQLRDTLSTFTDPYAKTRRGGLLGG